MELLVFLLGGAFGISLSNLFLLMEECKEKGYSEEILWDILYELISIVFVFGLLNVYIQVR